MFLDYLEKSGGEHPDNAIFTCLRTINMSQIKRPGTLSSYEMENLLRFVLKCTSLVKIIVAEADAPDVGKLISESKELKERPVLVSTK